MTKQEEHEILEYINYQDADYKAASEIMHDKTTDDCISRQAAIKAVSRECWEFRGIFERCKEKLLSLSSAQLELPWIPCSERMPVLDKAVLATTAWNDVTIAWRVGIDEWRIHEGNTNAETDDLIAWMPLPEPYKPQQEDNI